MIVTINKQPMLSTIGTPTSGDIVKSPSNSIIALTKNDFFDSGGIFTIRGNGQIVGASNPSNTIQDAVSLLLINPLINQSAKPLFSKLFTNGLSFVFDIELNISTAVLSTKFLFSDGDSGITNTGIGLNTTGITLYAMEHAIASGLYAIQIDNVYSDFKTIIHE